MKINIHIRKKYFFALLITMLLLIGGIVVYAITPGIAPNPGHVSSEIAPPSTCQAGQVLQWTGSDWTCLTLSGGGGGGGGVIGPGKIVQARLIAQQGGSTSLAYLKGSSGVTDTTSTTYYRVKCNAQDGWELIGCWVECANCAGVASFENECGVYRFLNNPAVELGITCIKTN